MRCIDSFCDVFVTLTVTLTVRFEGGPLCCQLVPVAVAVKIECTVLYIIVPSGVLSYINVMVSSSFTTCSQLNSFSLGSRSLLEAKRTRQVHILNWAFCFRAHIEASEAASPSKVGPTRYASVHLTVCCLSEFTL